MATRLTLLTNLCYKKTQSDNKITIALTGKQKREKRRCLNDVLSDERDQVVGSKLKLLGLNVNPFPSNSKMDLITILGSSSSVIFTNNL